jgi:hypothetical protein
MKKTLSILFLSALLMAGCGSSKKYVESGNYDAAINKAVAELRKNPGSEKDIESLERAMNIALEQDNERIRYLKVEGRANAGMSFILSMKMNDKQRCPYRHPD